MAGRQETRSFDRIRSVGNSWGTFTLGLVLCFVDLKYWDINIASMIVYGVSPKQIMTRYVHVWHNTP